MFVKMYWYAIYKFLFNLIILNFENSEPVKTRSDFESLKGYQSFTVPLNAYHIFLFLDNRELSNSGDA